MQNSSNDHVNNLTDQNEKDALLQNDPLVKVDNKSRSRSPTKPSQRPPLPPSPRKTLKNQTSTNDCELKKSSSQLVSTLDQTSDEAYSGTNTSNKDPILVSTIMSDMTVDKLKNISVLKYSDTSSSSIPISFDNLDGAKGHNQIASKLLGHREELMQLYMVKRQDDYTERKSFRLFAGTWNVNGRPPPSSVQKWLGTDADPPDVYVIGFQELDLSKEAFVFTESLREDEWRTVVTKSLHPGSQYTLVKLMRLVGMMVLVYVAEEHQPAVSQVQAHYVGTGLLGRMGNKGGVAVRFSLHSSEICVVNSHLAAHADLTERRNEDFKEICSRMRFPGPDGQGSVSIFQHDIVIWVGDLNYRIDGLPSESVKKSIDKEEYKLLKEYDQLICERRAGKVFQNFEEGNIDFRPTYKYNPGTDVWDTSEKCRTPAWCDRILWRETLPHTSARDKKPAKSMHLRAYRSHQALKISDHKPVSALFDMDVKVIDQIRYRQVYEEEIRRLDKMENDWLPTMTLSSHTFEFDEVRFLRPVQRSLELHNTGQIPCHFEFIAKFEEKTYCKPWLTISKPRGFIMPGEKEVIDLEIYVNRTTAEDLNIGLEKIEDILILHLVGGKDFFLTLNGRYLPSCFGMPLEVLCEVRGPIRDVPQSEILALSKDKETLSTANSGLKVPKELWKILDHLYHNALKQEDLFQQPGLHTEMWEIQECLDCELPCTDGANNLPGSNHSVVEALLVFLESLPNPVIPFPYYYPCLEVANDYQKANALVKTMPTCHRSVFFYLIAFLQEILKYRKFNALGLGTIASIFGGLILRPAKRKPGLEIRVEKQNVYTFIENFLTNPVDDS